jgi:hypothetical protein
MDVLFFLRFLKKTTLIAKAYSSSDKFCESLMGCESEVDVLTLSVAISAVDMFLCSSTIPSISAGNLTLPIDS